MLSFRKQAVMPDPADVLPGRSIQMPVPEKHAVNGNRIVPPFPERMKTALFGLGLLLGRGEEVLAASGGLQHRCRLRGGLDAEPDV